MVNFSLLFCGNRSNRKINETSRASNKRRISSRPILRYSTFRDLNCEEKWMNRNYDRCSAINTDPILWSLFDSFVLFRVEENSILTSENSNWIGMTKKIDLYRVFFLLSLPKLSSFVLVLKENDGEVIIHRKLSNWKFLSRKFEYSHFIQNNSLSVEWNIVLKNSFQISPIERISITLHRIKIFDFSNKNTPSWRWDRRKERTRRTTIRPLMVHRATAPYGSLSTSFVPSLLRAAPPASAYFPFRVVQRDFHKRVTGKKERLIRDATDGRLHTC